MRLLKWISLGLGALVALAVLGMFAILWFVDPNRFKPDIESAVRDATGRELELVGDIELGVFPWLALRAGEGRFSNPPGFGDEPMVSWRSAQLGARLFPLLRGELVADRVVLRGADVRLRRRADGVANWEGIGGQSRSSARSEPMDFRIGGIRIEDSRISFVDEVAGRRLAIESLSLTTDEIARGEPLTDTGIGGVLHMPGFAAEGLVFEVDVPELDAPADFSAIDVPEFEIAVGGLEMAGRVRGALGERPELRGAVSTNVFDPRALLATIGVAAPKTTDPAALGRLSLTGEWSFAAGAAALEPFTLRLDDTTLIGHFRVRANGAGGEFRLRGDRLDVSRYIPPPDPASEPFALPTAALEALTFRGVLELEKATLADVELEGVSLRLVLDDHGLRTEQAAP